MPDAAAPRGPAAPYWIGLDRDTYATRLADLRRWADLVLRQQYGGYELRDCWPRHVHAIWELSTLAAEWHRTYGGLAPTSPGPWSSTTGGCPAPCAASPISPGACVPQCVMLRVPGDGLPGPDTANSCAVRESKPRPSTQGKRPELPRSDSPVRKRLLVGERAPFLGGEPEDWPRPGPWCRGPRSSVADLADLDALATVTAEAGLAPAEVSRSFHSSSANLRSGPAIAPRGSASPRNGQRLPPPCGPATAAR